ncbi:MAG: LacI family DNA-binding transcriptional regulator, partial [Atribacterota bacterium]
MVTLKDIATRAGVSISTVSYYLNQKIELSPATASRIEEAMKELHYQPRRLSRKKLEQKLVGVIIPDIENPYYSMLVKKLEIALIRYGYSLILSNTDYSYDLEYTFMEVLKKKEVNGIILSPANSLPRKKKVHLNMPLILLDQ